MYRVLGLALARTPDSRYEVKRKGAVRGTFTAKLRRTQVMRSALMVTEATLQTLKRRPSQKTQCDVTDFKLAAGPKLVPHPMSPYPLNRTSLSFMR